MKPYAMPKSRARALYGIPTAPSRNRALELCHDGDPLLLDCTWSGESRTIGTSRLISASTAEANLRQVDYGKPLPFKPGSFELVLLHKTLDDLKFASRGHQKGFNPGELVAQIADLLVPGGVVAGCIGNASSPKRIKRWLARGHLGQTRNTPPFLTIRGCRQLLQMAGFTDIRLFSLLPDWESPLKLVEIEPAVSRFGFRQEFEGRRDQMPAPSYWLRRMVAGLGLYPYFEESVFFWAYKPC